MPARPISPETLQLIDAVRNALAGCAEVEEKTMFGCHVFMVNGKMCVGVDHEELFVRLPPAEHAQVAETPGVRPLSPRGLMNGYFLISPAAYATRAQWEHWINGALAFNPQAKATPKKRSKTAAAADASPPAKDGEPGPSGATGATRRKHSIFSDDDD
jgi:TfoX/Sxy family transcriptional regulator of competence genes